MGLRLVAFKTIWFNNNGIKGMLSLKKQQKHQFQGVSLISFHLIKRKKKPNSSCSIQGIVSSSSLPMLLFFPFAQESKEKTCLSSPSLGLPVEIPDRLHPAPAVTTG